MSNSKCFSCCAGGEGGGIAVFDAFLAVINTTVVGIATTADAFRTDSVATTGAADAAAAAQYSGVARSAFQGGCISIESASFYMSGCVLRQCSARFVGGALSMLAVTAVVKDSIISDNTADMVSISSVCFLCQQQFVHAACCCAHPL